MTCNRVFFVFLWSMGAFFAREIKGAWHDPSYGKFEYIYIGAPGIFSSEVQFAKLTPRFIASTGEIVRCENGIHVVPDTVIVQNLSEISKRHSIKSETLTYLLKTAPIIPLGALLINRSTNDSLGTFCVVGLVAYAGYVSWRPLNFLASAVSHKKFGFSFEGETGSHESIRQHAIDPFKINVAQDDDVALYLNAIENRLTLEPHKKKKAILYGVSRGSATVFHSFAKINLNKESDKIGAVICEGIFDSVPNIIHNAPLQQRIKVGTLMTFSNITRFKKDGMSPLSMLEHITDKDKPIALITSKIDTEVPYKNTLHLYEKLRKDGHTNVHLLVLENSHHNEYSVGSEKDKYQAFIHAFYRKYDLPYIPQFADEGEQYLQTSQPGY